MSADGFYEYGPQMPATPANELELELHLQRVILRDFVYELRPLEGQELRPGVWLRGLGGLELVAVAKDTGLMVSLRFERSEFVNIATTGLAMLDAGDATEKPEEVN